MLSKIWRGNLFGISEEISSKLSSLVLPEISEVRSYLTDCSELLKFLENRYSLKTSRRRFRHRIYIRLDIFDGSRRNSTI